MVIKYQKLLKKEKNIQFILKETIRKFGLSPYKINDGSCEEFAHEIQEQIPEAEIWETIFEANAPQHLFLKIGDKFYDAETVDGVKNYQNLPIFKKAGIKEEQRIAQRVE